MDLRISRLLQRLLPIRNAGLGLARSLRSFDATAADASVIQPEEVTESRPAAYLPGQLERATAAAPLVNLESEVAYARQTRTKHAPVIKYTLIDCLVHEAGFDVAGFTYRKMSLRKSNFLRDTLVEVPRAIYCNSSPSQTYFGHWLHDSCSAAMLKADDEDLFLDVRPDWRHAAEYATALALVPTTCRLALVKEFSVYQDYGQGSHKRQRYAEMRSRLAGHFRGRAGKERAVYLTRRTAGAARAIENEDEVIAALTGRGFEIFDLEGASVRTIHEQLSNAKVVVSMEGGHVNHVYYSVPQGSSLLTLIASDRFTMSHLGYARAFGLHYGFLVAEPGQGGNRVDVGNLLRTLDLVERAAT